MESLELVLSAAAEAVSKSSEEALRASDKFTALRAELAASRARALADCNRVLEMQAEAERLREWLATLPK